MNYLQVPGTGIRLVDGSIVILARFPETKWIVHNGWYMYQGQQYTGWYFCSIPAQTILPVNNEDLKSITVVDNDCSCSCNPVNPGSCPPPNLTPMIPFTPQMAVELDRAWISVDTIAQRDQLNNRLVPDGKIVRVNETAEGNPAYFRWNQAKQIWEDENFGIDKPDSAVGDATTPIYINSSGVPTAFTNTLGTTVPADAIFTDNKVQATSITSGTIYLTGVNGDGTAGVSISTGQNSLWFNVETGTLVAPRFTGTAALANSATKATQDGSGNIITQTYATKNELKKAVPTWETF